MESNLYIKFLENEKEKRYLDENSYWIKYLNRDPNNYYEFIRVMKEKYKERPTDKLESAINTIDIINTVLNTIKYLKLDILFVNFLISN